MTQQVRALERHFGVRLVDVVGRRPVLTDAGHFLASRTMDLLGANALLEEEMREFAEARAGTLHVGATLTIGTYTLPRILARFSAEHAGVVVQVEVESTETIACRVVSGSLGLALIQGPLEDDGLEIIPFQWDCLVLVVSPHHPFAERKRVRLQDLDGQPFVWRERGSGTRLLAERALDAAGVRVHTVLELPGGEGVARAVETGMGVAILSALVVDRAVLAGQLTAIEIIDADLSRSFRLIHLRDRTLSPAAHAFIQLVISGGQRNG